MINKTLSTVLVGLLVLLLGGSLAQARPFALVPNYFGDSVSVIDLATNAVTFTIDLGAEKPMSVAMHPSAHRAFVTFSVDPSFPSGGSVIVINTDTFSEVARMNVCSAYQLAVNPSGTRLYVSGSCITDDTDTNLINVFDAESYAPLGQIELYDENSLRGGSMVVSPDGELLYVSMVKNLGGDTPRVAIVDTATNALISSIELEEEDEPKTLRLSPNGSRLYATSLRNNQLIVIDTDTRNVLSRITVGIKPIGLAISPDGSSLYVANEYDHTVSVISTASNQVTATVGGGSTPLGIGLNPSGSRVYVVNNGSDRVSVIDTASNTRIVDIPVGRAPYAFGTFITPQQTIVAEPDYLNFGGILAGGSSHQLQFAIHNQGNTALTINAVSLAGDNGDQFELSQDDCSARTLAANGGSCSLGVTFSPILNGEKQAYLAISSNDPENPALFVQMAGTGLAPDLSIVNAVEPINTFTLSFGRVPIDGFTAEVVNIVNRGNRDLEIGSIAGNDPAAPPMSALDKFCPLTGPARSI
jgi:YVTN family beta-propeller protein